MKVLLRSVLTLALAMSLARPCFAENKTAAREAFRRAQQHYNLAEYDEALADFKTAYRNFEDPSFLFNIAQCERALNHKPEAIRAYKTYLAASPNAPNRDDVSAIIQSLEKAVADERAAANRPPQGTIGTAPPSEPHATTAAPEQPSQSTLVAAQPAPERKTPTYKKWWVWTLVGGAAAAAVGIGLGVGLTTSGSPATASTSLGTVHPF